MLRPEYFRRPLRYSFILSVVRLSPDVRIVDRDGVCHGQ